MNTHEREAFERAVFDYLEGALDESAAKALRQQVQAFPQARALFEQAQALWALLHDGARLEAETLPHIDLKGAVLDAIQLEPIPEDSPEWEKVPQASIAAAARALYIDPPDEDIAAAATEFRGLSDTHRREVDAYARLTEDLAAIERDAILDLPTVNLRDAVLETIAGHTRKNGETPPPTGRTIVSFQRGNLHRAQPVQWPLIAAAAVLLTVLGGWVLFMPGSTETPVQTIAEPIDTPPAPPEPPTLLAEPQPEPEISQPAPSALESAFTLMAEALPEPMRVAPVAVATHSPDLALLTPADIWTSQQAALTSPEARGALRALARVPEEQARAIAEQPETGPLARAGAAAVLPPAEAQVALLAVRAGSEPTPSLVFAQAKAAHDAIEADPEAPPPAEVPSLDAIIAELREIDPENALSYYWEAIGRLQAGDVEGARALLEAAERLESASAYSLDTARATEAALHTAGMSPDTAAAAAALTAGMNQYDFLTSVGQQLLDEAVRYEAMGDAQTAEQILSAAQRLGEQIEIGGSISWEQLAGLDLQRAAIEALEAFLTSTDDLVALTNDALGLVASMDSMVSFFNAFNNLFLSTFDSDFLSDLSQAILGQGDMDFLQFYSTPLPPAGKRR